MADDRISRAPNIAELRRQLRNPVVREGEQRSSSRRNCKWRAMISAPPVEIGCVIEDISLGGCRAQVFCNKIAVGVTLTLTVPSRQQTFFGRIVWKRADEIGIRFC